MDTNKADYINAAPGSTIVRIKRALWSDLFTVSGSEHFRFSPSENLNLLKNHYFKIPNFKVFLHGSWKPHLRQQVVLYYGRIIVTQDTCRLTCAFI